jgi:lysophospholipase L1-like esterase
MSTEPVKAPRWKRLLQNVGLSFAVFFLCGLTLEGVLRLNGYGNLEIYEPDPALYWKLKPNQNCYTKIDRKPVHVNSLGTRGPEFQPIKPSNTIRVLSLGDSRTFGWGLAEAETYSGRLQQLLQAKVSNGKTVEVINAGVNAWSYPQMLVYLRDTALKYSPDIVILGEANHWTQFSERNSPEFVKQFMSRVRLKNFLRRFATYHYVVEVKLKAFYERHRTKFIPVDPKQDTLFKEQQQSDPDSVFRTAIEDICALATNRNVKPVLLYLPTLDDLHGTNDAPVLKVKRDLSRRSGVPLVDLTSALRPQANELYLEADPVHLNAKGNDIIARELSETVAHLLPQ